MNRSLTPLCLLLIAGCASVQRVRVKDAVVPLPNGRFIGPIEIPVPRRADHDNHDFEIRVTLRARCAPLLTLAFPDGETQELGENNRRWQDLLVRRAKAQSVLPVAPPPVPAPAEPVPAPVQPLPAPSPDTVAAVDVEVTIPGPPAPAGHWQPTLTETWPGQLQFDKERAIRCERRGEYRLRYLNAFDESGTLALWAEVPQELYDAELHYEIIELVTPRPPPPPAEVVAVAVEPPRVRKPRPPAPAPKRESPDPAEERAATWLPGSWSWAEGRGEWVWYEGHWLAPAQAPALKFESTANPPNPGCTWVRGYWAWEQTAGRWVWQPGRWKPPPPRQEVRGTPPGDGAPWIDGYWTSNGSVFIWIAGRWGKPWPRDEKPPPPPFAGALWIPGDWIFANGTYVWSPGFHQGPERPPAPRAETPPPSPGPGAIWLQGYWRWDAGLREHQWIAGHWELPPGEGYVWIPAPAQGGIVIGGRWELLR